MRIAYTYRLKRKYPKLDSSFLLYWDLLGLQCCISLTGTFCIVQQISRVVLLIETKLTVLLRLYYHIGTTTIRMYSNISLFVRLTASKNMPTILLYTIPQDALLLVWEAHRSYLNDYFCTVLWGLLNPLLSTLNCTKLEFILLRILYGYHLSYVLSAEYIAANVKAVHIEVTCNR